MWNVDSDCRRNGLERCNCEATIFAGQPRNCKTVFRTSSDNGSYGGKTIATHTGRFSHKKLRNIEHCCDVNVNVAAGNPKCNRWSSKQTIHVILHGPICEHIGSAPNIAQAPCNGDELPIPILDQRGMLSNPHQLENLNPWVAQHRGV